MTNEIIRKLNDHVAKGLSEEADVTYVLVQLGKLLERESAKVDYSVMRFYRDWVVREKLSKTKANPPMGAILDNFETIGQAAQFGRNIQVMAR